jgi:hypothetical protein
VHLNGYLCICDIPVDGKSPADAGLGHS